MRKGSFLQQMVLGTANVEIGEITHSLTPYPKINSDRLKAKSIITKALEENTRAYVRILRKAGKMQHPKETIDHSDNMKFKDICVIKGLPRWHKWKRTCLPRQKDIRDVGLIPGSGKSPGEGNANPLQYSCLENPMDRGIWRLQSMGSQRVGYD